MLEKVIQQAVEWDKAKKEATDMARATPQVVGSILNVEKRQIEVGTEDWFTWLIEARSFAYHDGQASFTARKQQRKEFWYWYAYTRRDGRLRCLYLGRPNSLTVERLRTITRALHPPVEEPQNGLQNRRYDQEEKQDEGGQRRDRHIRANRSLQKSKQLDVARVRVELAEIEAQLAKRGRRKREAGLQALEMAELMLQALNDERERVRVIATMLQKAVE